MKRTYIIGGIILVVLAGLLVGRFLAGDEDAWICQDGQWIAHGAPSAPKPTTPCGEATATPTPTPMRTVKLYYYNAASDKDSSGNIMCSSQGLVSVSRQIPRTITPIQDTIRLLLKGELTAQEQAWGITTEYPLPGFSLIAASLDDEGALTLTFEDSQNRTGGGSCRVGILWAQIEATAKQFSEVTSVRFMPEELFQP